jgi:hypothetical protein
MLILIIFDIAQTILDVVSCFGAAFGFYLSNYDLPTCTMNSPGGAPLNKPGGYTKGNESYTSSRSDRGGSGGNRGGSGGDRKGGLPSSNLLDQQARNYETLINRHAYGYNLSPLEYDILFRRVAYLRGLTEAGLANDDTPLERRIELRESQMELVELKSSLLESVTKVYPNYRLP